MSREALGPCTRRTGLVISEIMYHPRVVPAATNRSLQYIEIYNATPWTEDLSGYQIAGNVTYTIPDNTQLPPREFLLVARDPALIGMVYGVSNVVGPWNTPLTSALSTTQGVVQFLNPVGAVLLDIGYSDVVPWPVAADGTGHSLVLARPSYGENNPLAWAQSDVIGGSPGMPEPNSIEPLASVVINEWLAHTDPPLQDYIEIYNHSNQEVDLSGAYLTDSPETNVFRFTNGTRIQPRQFLWYQDVTLGFQLLSEGERIYLVNSNQNRVIDAIDFRGQSNAVSSGRFPDGGPVHYAMTSRTPGTANAAPKRWAVTITEMMYNPMSGSLDDEYIEIYNRSGQALNISQWEFVNGISYSFSNNVTMPAGAYWVVARNPSNLFNIYPNLNTNNTFGPYAGTLANGGERINFAAADYGNFMTPTGTIQLKLAVAASEFFYNDGGRWTLWSDGQGSSLELIDVEADPHFPANWADSDASTNSQWTAIEATVPLGETLGPLVNDSLIIGLQGIGECLLDEVEVRVDNGPNLVANGGFESDLNDWDLQGSHDFSTIQTGGAFAGTKCLHVRAASRGDNQSNRILSAPFAVPIPGSAGVVSLRAKAKWLRGHPELLLRLHGGGAEAYGRLAVPQRLGTPGLPNSRKLDNAGPAIHDVQHSPILPADNEPVRITARLSDPQGLSAFTLRYRIDPAPNYQSVPMFDNGISGDLIRDDGIFSGVIPGQPEGTVVAFYLEARDSGNVTATFPKDVFPPQGLTRCWPNDAVARECVVRFGDVQMPGDFPTYHLWITAANSNRWHTRDTQNNTALDGTFVYNDSRIIYNALPLYSGSPWHRANATNGPTGVNRVDYEMNFPDDDPLYGSTDFILQNPGNPNLTTISDLSAMAEQTVYHVLQGLGLIVNHRRYIHFFVNGNQRSTTTQREGNFIFEDSQQPNGEMIEQWFPNNAGGQLFKVEDWFEFDPNGYDPIANNDADLERRTILIDGQPTLVPAPYRYMFRKRSIGIGASANDFSDIFDLVNAVSPFDNPTNEVVDPVAFSQVADIEEWMLIFAVQRIVGNWDSYGWERGKNDYLYRGADGLFRHMTWDIDYSMGLGRPATEPLFESNDPRVRAMFNTPAIVRAYWRAFLDLVNGPFSNAYLDPFIDGRAATLFGNDINIDLDAVNAIKTYISERQAFVQGQLESVVAPFAVDLPETFSTTNDLLIITGSAPVNVFQILINDNSYPIVWTSVTNFMFRLVLGPDLNVIVLQGLDRAGEPIVGASSILNVTYTGPVADPASAFVISEIMYNPLTPGGQFLEIMNRSDNNFDLTGWRVQGLNLTFPPGSIVTNHQTLILAQDANAFETAYGGVPMFADFGGALSSIGQIVALIKPGETNDLVVDAVRYEIQAPWPGPVAGASLQLIDETQANDRSSNWALDPTPMATPGAPNSVAATLEPFDPLWLNEMTAYNLTGPTDNAGDREPWIELYNSGPDPVSLDGYYLADNVTSNLLQWAFPSGLSIGPGQFFLVWADGEPLETVGNQVHTSMRLDYSGQIALVRVVASQPQIVDYLVWDTLGPDTSFGELPEGQQVYQYVLYEPTPGLANTNRLLRVFINEWMARNTMTLDPADFSTNNDWFEVYNGENFTVNLGGYCLTDDPEDPTQFRIPNNGRYTLTPGGFRLVWADDSPGQNSANFADLHVNFQLGGNSGFIGLYAPDGETLIDSVNYLSQTNDISEGRYSDGSKSRYYMPRSTPRRPNGIPGFNSWPVYPIIPQQFVIAGQSNLISNAFAFDPDGNAMVQVVDPLRPITDFNANGFRWRVPTNQAPGDYLFTLHATDNGIPPRSSSVSFYVTVFAPNTPVITTVPPPVIETLSSAGGSFTLTFGSNPGSAYRVLYSDNLVMPNWMLLEKEFVAANPIASITDLVPVSQRFYRVQRLP